MKATFIRTLNGLAPAPDDPGAASIMRRTTYNDLVEVEAIVPRDQRSLKMHNLFFAVLKHVFDNLPERYGNEIPTPEILRERIFFEIGFVRIIKTRNGPRQIPKSLAFAKLGQDQFNAEVWEPTMRLIDKMAPGLGEAFEAEYLAMVT